MPVHLEAGARVQSAWELLTGDLTDDIAMAKGLFASDVPDFSAVCNNNIQYAAVTQSQNSELEFEAAHRHKRHKPNGYRHHAQEESQASDDDTRVTYGLSKEAEVFALQGIRISLLNKLAEVCPQLCAVMKENKLYRSVLIGLGQDKDELKRTVELACLKQYQLDVNSMVSDGQATAIAGAALGNNENSPVDALGEVLGHYRYSASIPVETAPSTPELHSSSVPAHSS